MMKTNSFFSELESGEKRKIVAIYTRVSTNEQAEEGYSIFEQKRLLEEWCNNKGYDVYRCYSDSGISGKI